MTDTSYKDVCVSCYKKQYYEMNKDKIDTVNKLNYDLKYKVKHEEIRCVHCTTAFVPKHSSAKCCSRKCSDKLWKINNNEYVNQWHKDHYHNSVERRLATCIRSRTNKALKGSYKQYSVTEFLGCSPDYLIKHLESKFVNGMTWENYGKGSDRWNVDHIIPLASFDLTNREQFAKACNYTNLQPLWEPENIRKGNRYEKNT